MSLLVLRHIDEPGRVQPAMMRSDARSAIHYEMMLREGLHIGNSGNRELWKGRCQVTKRDPA
jgi:hypothetical protein